MHKCTQTPPNWKKHFVHVITLITLAIVSTNIFANNDSRSGPPALSSSLVVSAPNLFSKSISRTQTVLGASHEGAYSHLREFEPLASIALKQHIIGLYELFSDSAVDIPWAVNSSQILFSAKETINLGIDLNFSVGKILSENTRIISINKTIVPHVDTNGIDQSISSTNAYGSMTIKAVLPQPVKV